MFLSPISLLTLILVVAFALMLTNRVRADVVAVCIALALGLFGVVKPDQVFAGFSRSAVITIIGIFILAQGLQRAGVTRAIGKIITRLSKGSERGMILIVMACGAFLSLFMNNIAAAAVALPATVDAVKRRNVSPSKTMMPLAFATSLGGMATLLTTGNIVVGAALQEAGFRGYGLLDFIPVGVSIVFVGVLFMLTIGRKLLPNRATLLSEGADALQKSYELNERLNRARVPQNSSLVNKRIAQSDIGKEFGLSVMALLRGDETLLAPPPTQTIFAGDVLLLVGRKERVQQLIQRGDVVGEKMDARDIALISDDVSMVEITLAPRSRAVGQTLKDLRFREKFGANVIAVWNNGTPVRTDIAHIPLNYGDALLAQASNAALALLQSDPDFLVLRPPLVDSPIRVEKFAAAILIFAASLLLSAFEILPIAEAMMLGAIAMVLIGCLTMDEAYRAVDWRAVFLIAGMLPVSIAMTHTGAADAIAQTLVSSLSRFGALPVAAGLLVVTMLLAQVMSGQVAAVVLAPIAISAAMALGSDPRAMAMFVALGTSLTFITPTAHPVNVFVMGAGGYTASDFPRVGLWLSLVLILVILLVAPIFWKL
jgi:di/tricarboxylate transporter